MATRTHLWLLLLGLAYSADWVDSITVSFNSQPTAGVGKNDSSVPARARRLISTPYTYQYYVANNVQRYQNIPLLQQAQGGPPRLPLLLTLAPVLNPSYQRVLARPATTTTTEAPITRQEQAKAAPGRPGVDYPTYDTIPPTTFDCRTQRYKGFFADPSTQCQVWHYCDLNGGQASFLCPNGTIFSQVLLTCDWWFNVRCNSSLQAYVLNERLYKFITPHKPSFPEDFSGPQVDEYLAEKQDELRAKEQAKFDRIKNKYKQHEFEDVDELQALLDKMRDRQR